MTTTPFLRRDSVNMRGFSLSHPFKIFIIKILFLVLRDAHKLNPSKRKNIDLGLYLKKPGDSCSESLRSFSGYMR
jgi:hypothetical protein